MPVPEPAGRPQHSARTEARRAPFVLARNWHSYRQAAAIAWRRSERETGWEPEP